MTDGVRLLQQKRYKEALDYFLKQQVHEDEYATLSYYLGICYTHVGQFDEALLYLEQVVDSDIGFLHIYQCRMIMGYIYAVTDRHRLAEFEFNRLLEDGYESAKVYSALAYVVYAQGKVAPAIAFLEKALKIDPENANALNSMGYILAENDIQLKTALDYCGRAVSKQPRNPSYLDSLALALWKNNDRKRAKEAFDRAVKLSGGRAEIVQHYRQFVAAGESAK